MNVTYKHLRLFVEQEEKGWLASVCDLSRFEFVYEGRRFHRTVEEARKEAEAKAREILKEIIEVDWPPSSSMKAHG